MNIIDYIFIGLTALFLALSVIFFISYLVSGNNDSNSRKKDRSGRAFVSGNSDRSHTSFPQSTGNGYKLILFDLAHNDEYECLFKDSATIGRVGADININDSGIAARQCSIVLRDGEFYVVNNAIENTIKLNYNPINGESHINNCDWLQIGAKTYQIIIESNPGEANEKV